MKCILFPHGGSGNHGCEAIVRTTKDLLNKGNHEVVLFSDAVDEDIKYLGRELMQIKKPRKEFSRYSAAYGKAFIDYHIRKQKDAFDKLHFSPVLSECEKGCVLLSIGGDNYCYGDNEYIYLVNKYVREKGAKTILWGCSVEPKEITEKMRKDLERYDLIVARESLTLEALAKINKNTILKPDPAFTLKTQPGKMPEELREGPFIGINMSPMIQSKEAYPGIAMKNYENMIQSILDQTEYRIALIPHVVWSHNDDRIPLGKLHEKFKTTNRVFLVEDQNCMQLKEIISKASFFVGARTHATIAAYSTQVPTLVIGYSVKARGIAKDLFGTQHNYVIPVQSLEREEDLAEAFQWMQEHESEIRTKLAAVMPNYIRNAESLSATVTVS